MTASFSLSDADVASLGEGEVLVRDDMLSSVAVAACSKHMSQRDRTTSFPAAGMGASSQQVQVLRGDRTSWLGEEQGPLWCLNRLFDDVRRELNEAAWMGLASFTAQLAIYDGKGECYVAHRDTVQGGTVRGDPARRATAIIYLNPDWQREDGGCLRVHPPSGSSDLEPLGGRLVVFRSDCLLHEVLPCHSVRRAATAWYRGRASDPLRNVGKD